MIVSETSILDVALSNICSNVLVRQARHEAHASFDMRDNAWIL